MELLFWVAVRESDKEYFIVLNNIRVYTVGKADNIRGTMNVYRPIDERFIVNDKSGIIVKKP